MNNKIFLILICVICSCNICFAQNDIKDKLRNEYLSFIKEEGFTPVIDSEGDIKFKIEGNNHFIIIKNEESPQYIIFMTRGFKVGGDDGFDKDICLMAVNEVNKKKRSAKLDVGETTVSVRIEMPLVDTESFKNVFYKPIRP